MVKFDGELQALKALEEAFELLKSKNPGIQEEPETAFKLGHYVGCWRFRTDTRFRQRDPGILGKDENPRVKA
jgi:hypothetical protein